MGLRTCATAGLLVIASWQYVSAEIGGIRADLQALMAFGCMGGPANEDVLRSRLPDDMALTALTNLSRTGRPDRFTAHVTIKDRGVARIRIDDRGPDFIRATAVVNDRAERPLAQVRASMQGEGQPCIVIDARRLVYDDQGYPQSLVILDDSLADTDERIDFNPPVPFGTTKPGIRVAHVDSGVAYTLDTIAGALARDDDGGILGYDFQDDDLRPFDLDFSRSPFFPLRHGTTVASILIREAQDVRLMPVRYPRQDMSRMDAVVARAVAGGARIVAMPLGSNEPSDWTAFANAARFHPKVLFIVSAGNDGRDIDRDPVYPAALDLPNMIVVTSADDFGRLARDSNWGADSVDLMVPAEGIEVIDHRGATVRASGSSYAVPRVAAMAARLLARHKDWVASDIISHITKTAAPSRDRGAPRVKLGWLPDPLSVAE